MLTLPEIKHYLSVLDMDVRDARMLLGSSIALLQGSLSGLL